LKAAAQSKATQQPTKPAASAASAASAAKPAESKAPAKKPATAPTAAKAKPKAKPAEPAKPAKKAAEVKTAAPLTQASNEPARAAFFPERIEHENLGAIIARHEMTYDDLIAMISSEEPQPVYLACYWSAAQIKKHQYAEQFRVKAPKAFPKSRIIVPNKAGPNIGKAIYRQY
jgi:hypothetical protein